MMPSPAAVDPSLKQGITLAMIAHSKLHVPRKFNPRAFYLILNQPHNTCMVGIILFYTVESYGTHTELICEKKTNCVGACLS
jgi:hypothetical protein